MVGDALARLGELRRRQGRLTEAEELFARAESHTITLLGRAQLALDRDQAEEAAELSDRYLRRFPERGRVERSAGLEVAVRAFAGVGELERSEDALSELRGIATRAKTRPIQAAVYASEGALAATRGDHNTARCSFEDAIDLFAACDAPYEAGRVRLDLAATLRAQGRQDRARREIEAAITAFREIGAEADRARAEAMLEKRRNAGPAMDGPLATLSTRELEVLGLVAEGLTNHDIAQRLVLSEHTVNRHVANILRKLGLNSRTAAASLAGRYGLGMAGPSHSRARL
jgi:LuxR family transcriptional regulator, maltose regulon positive regulatory protein